MYRLGPLDKARKRYLKKAKTEPGSSTAAVGATVSPSTWGGNGKVQPGLVTAASAVMLSHWTATHRVLTGEENRKIDAALVEGEQTDIVTSKAISMSHTVTRGHLRTLVPDVWLNDEIINFWLCVLVENHINTIGEPKKIHCFSSFFWTRLMEGKNKLGSDSGYQYTNVRRWTRNMDIFALDVILVPINEDRTHWVLAAIYPQQSQILFYDSFHSEGRQYLEALRQYVTDEAKSRNKKPREWTLVTGTAAGTDSPMQTNQVDCGVFACMAAEHLALGEPLTYTKEDMPLFRYISTDVLASRCTDMSLITLQAAHASPDFGRKLKTRVT